MFRAKWVVFVAGAVVGAVLALAADRLPRAEAQQPAVKPAGSAGRYQVSAYGTGGNLHGAYVVDTTTGEVFLCEQANRPRSLGKPEPK